MSSRYYVVDDAGNRVFLDELPKPPPQTCRGCGENPAVGLIFTLCDPCFEAFERRIDEGKDETGMYKMSDKELELLNNGPWVKRPA